MKRKRSRNNVYAALKLDMMKAYDRVEWHFLEAMPLKLGFDANLVRLIMKCVTSVRFFIRVNGELQPYFNPSRGLRQGCPVSPYLFLLCAEGLTALLKSYGTFIDRGIRVSFRAPWVSHLLFADDNLLLFKASVEGAVAVSNLLDKYCSASGQRVNHDKSSIFSAKDALVRLEMM